MTRIRTLTVLLVASGVGLLPACGSSSSSAKKTTDAAAASASAEGITIKDFGFKVGAATAGQPITVTNNDGPKHTVTLDDGSQTVELAGGGNSATLTIDKAGTYPFHCEIHPSMKATLTVG